MTDLWEEWKQGLFRHEHEETRFCRQCGEVKPLSEFIRNKNCKNGLESWCKKCHAQYMREYYKKNPIKAQKNKERMQQRRKEQRTTLAQKDFCKAKRDFSLDILDGYKIHILNYAKRNEYRYNCIRTDGRCYCTNDKQDFLTFLEKRI